MYPVPGDKMRIIAAPCYWHGAMAVVQFIDHIQPVRKIAVYLVDDPEGKNAGLLRFGIGEIVPAGGGG